MIQQSDVNIFLEKLKTAKNVVVFAHKNPDGDAVASVLAVARLLELNFDINVTCVYDGNIPDCLDFVPYRNRLCFIKKAVLPQKIDIAVALDYGIRKNIGDVLPVLEHADFIVEFDHHLNNDKIANLCLDDLNAPATAQIVYDFICLSGLKWDTEIAVLLATAMVTDTGNFKYIRDAYSFKVMADLVERGVVIENIIRGLENKPRKTIVTEASVAANAEFLFQNKLVLATIKNKDYKNLDGRGETVLDLLGQIKGVEYIVLLKEHKIDQIGVSLRGKKYPVQNIAASLGGGGHPYAAGAVIADNLENVRERIISVFKEVIK